MEISVVGVLPVEKMKTDKSDPLLRLRRAMRDEVGLKLAQELFNKGPTIVNVYESMEPDYELKAVVVKLTAEVYDGNDDAILASCSSPENMHPHKESS